MLEILNNFDWSSLSYEAKDWSSLIINRRKPYTYRIFTQVGPYRICFHTFDTCDKTESFIHPHAWPAAFKILRGSYEIKTGYSKNKLDRPTDFHRFILEQNSSYEMVNPLEWHSITPLEITHTVMINGEGYEHPHSEVRTTKGKDLESISKEDVGDSLCLFRWYLCR